jgi:hypothetical protein
VKVNGKDFCVEDCKKDCTAMGQECVDFTKAYAPKECSAKACKLGTSLFFTKGSKPVAASYATGYGSAYKVGGVGACWAKARGARCGAWLASGRRQGAALMGTGVACLLPCLP